MIDKIQSNFTLEKVYNLLSDENINVENKYEYIHPIKTNNRPITLSLGRIWFNELLPEDYMLINEPIPKPRLSALLLDISNKYTPEKGADTVQFIMQEAFKLSSINPKSFTIDTFIMSPDWIAKKKDFVKNAPKMDDKTFIEKANELAKEFMQSLTDKKIGIKDITDSKTKGELSDWQALMVSRGFVVDIEGNISRITEANNDGYNIESYYKGGGQARRNYYLKSTMTSKPGYLARRITMACANLKIASDDCGSTKYLKMNIDAALAPRFFGRYYKGKNNEVTEVTNVKDLIGKSIEFRSPLYCKDPNGVCSICYGNLHKLVKNKNVGILAGGAVNNEALNALMKLRHKSSQVSIIEVDFMKLIKDSNLNTDLINRVFEVEKTKISAKLNSKIIIDEKDYREDALTDLGDKFIIPGIMDVIVGDTGNEEIITFPFNFNVDLFKPDNTEQKGTIITLNYTEGEPIMEKKTYIKDVNPAIIDRLFEAGMKHITKPEILLNVLLNELTKSDSIHLELITMNMFRSKEDLTKCGRYVNYNNCKMVGAKEAPFIDSWLSALAFENPNKSIKYGLISEKDANLNPIENIVLDKFYNEGAEE